MKYPVLILLSIILFSCKQGDNSQTETYIVKKGNFYIDIVETGEINATQSLNISSPALSWRFGALKINYIVDDGKLVNKGDTLVLFDPSEIYKSKIDALAELEIAQAELKKLRAEQASKIQELESSLKINEINFDIAKINLEQASYEAEVTKKEIQLKLEKTEIELKKARAEIQNQQKIHREEVTQSKLKIKQLEANLEEANVTLKKLTVVSPGSGIAIIGKNWSTQNKWQVGDQPWSGTLLIQLPDLTELKVETDINEVDIAKIKKDQEAEIRLDAFSDKMYKGNVIAVATLAKFKDEDKSKIKVFPIEILLKKTSEELLPGMTVSCRIIVDEINDVLFVPLEAIHKEATGSFVFLKSGNSYKKKTIVTGLSNNDYIIVTEGIKEGDNVALSIPAEFAEDKNTSN
jgi:HlyD family secretion protein